MALHLNFYHEIHRQSERERRDPVKIAGLVALLLVILMVGWYFYRYSEFSALQRKQRAVEVVWSKLEPEMKAAEGSKEALLARQKTNQFLVHRLHGRFYWATLLERLAAVTPVNVQIVTFAGDLEEDKEGKKTVNLLIKGIAAGEQPRTEAESFRRLLQEKLAMVYSGVSAVFDANSLEDGSETVLLHGQTLSTATFRIRVQFSVAAPAAVTPTPKPAGGTR